MRAPRQRKRLVRAAVFVAASSLLLGQAACGPDDEDETLGWQQVASPTTAQLDAIWGTSSSDVWAVGHDGVALHFDGGGWTQVASGTSGVLHAVWGAAPDAYWAGDGDGKLLHWDGLAWSPDSWFAANDIDGIRSISGTGPDNVWVSTGFSLFHWTGVAWTPVPFPVGEIIDNVLATDPTEVWATGDSRDLLRQAGGGSWETFQVPDVGGVFIWNDISGCSPTDLWAVGSAVAAASGGAFAYHWEGTSWHEVSLFDDPQVVADSLEASWCRSSSDVWMVGGFATYHFDGSAWQQGSFGHDAMLAIWGAPSGDLWTVGSVGAIYHHPG